MKHFDLFSGYGGFTLALEKIYETNITLSRNRSTRPEHGGSSQSLLQGGSMPTTQEPPFATIGFSEIDKYASAVLKYHWPNTKNYGDITKIDWSEVPDFDLLTGGSPCQDLSIAGKRAGLEGARSGLFYEYMRAVKEKRPKYFIWENVKGALSSNKGFDFATVINEMAEAGYSLWWQVLNAKDFGVPQNRERIFVVGFRDGSPREVFFESNSNTETKIANGKISNSSNREFGFKDISPSCLARDYKEPKIVKLNNPTHSNNRLCSEEGISPALNTAQGGNRQPKIMRQPLKFLDRNQKNIEGDYAFTVDSMNTGGVKIDSRIRRLTPTECERLMGLPDGWTSKGIINDMGIEISDSQRYKLCGNGVVVNVVEEIIKELIIGS
jgi:DNA (cytosine-5)-methyltransferase 1